MTTQPITADAPVRSSKRWPKTLWIGLAIIAGCEFFLFADVRLTGRWVVHTEAAILAIPAPHGAFATFCRWMAAHMTAIVWVGYIFLLEGILAIQNAGGPVRRRPHHFTFLSLASVFIWCVFDWINFYYINAWDYIGLPQGEFDRFWSYLLAFAAIVPGMLMSGQVLLNMGWFNWARSSGFKMPRIAKWLALAAGVAMFVWPFVAKNSVTNYTLWTSLVLMLDPINLKLGRPSMFRDWQNGWYGRTLAAFAGGLMCGFCWEFWNYWALAKWTYHLPFLGVTEHIKYFEMPIVGLLGFMPFGLEAWVMWQSMRMPLDGLVEPLPDENSLL